MKWGKRCSKERNHLKVIWMGARPAALVKVRELLTPDVYDVISPETSNNDELAQLIEDADFLVVRRLSPDFKIDEGIIKAAKKLKLIQKIGMVTGNIDVEAAKKAGITVVIIPVMSENLVAEHAMMMILALSRNLINAHKAVANSAYLTLGLEPRKTSEWDFSVEWNKTVDIALPGIYGRTLGIIGAGAIGREVARRALCFGMRILYYDIFRLDPEDEKKLSIEYRSLDDLLSQSDFVTLHLPHTERTEKLIGAHELSLMKRTAFLVNTARGGLLDESALFRALKSKHIAGAGLDVYEYEPIARDNPLLKLENVIFTPHMAGGPQTIDLTEVCENIKRVTSSATRN